MFKNKKIKFVTEKKEKVLNISLSKKQVPEWYKKSEKFFNIEGQESSGLKTCVPFLDGIMAGYMVTTPHDIYINTKNDELFFLQTNNELVKKKTDFIEERPDGSGFLIPRPVGHNHRHLAWHNYTGFELPSGWSMLVTHPLNRFDLPFTTMSGLMDSDKWVSAGNIPFFLKNDIETVMPKGTPVAQLIPVKRANWTHSIHNYNPNLYIDKDARSVKYGFYKKNMWQKKHYD